MEKEQQVKMKKKKHRCKVCNKWFPSGRSLGGHMRSHGTVSVNNGDGNGYGLKDNPKRTSWRCSDSSEKQCRECGKCFPSCHALFGHMRCHSVKGLDLVLDVDLDLAVTLMMLSRDTGKNWDDLDLDLGLERSKDEIFVPEIDGNGNGKKSVYECSSCKKSFESYQALGGHRASHKRLRMEAIAIDGTVMPDLLDLNMPAVVAGDSNLKSSSSTSSSWWKCEPMLGLI
ncbi:beta-beta-alpha zinc fingers domain-containing protein [Dioscorea alata]|uniref:Beta-beta-alpha zinc fingers domain-containing protein n=1 Tax=Dioscorea alata TaxID=55571 RepID=A0ACB7VH62_DIOAL|nr:beta-beta-alpha zinc fingers domain-containing protein [Dioscorea alata]